MAPRLAMDYRPDSLFCNAVVRTDTGEVATLQSLSGSRTNGPDNIVRKYAKAVVFTPAKRRIHVTWMAFSDSQTTLGYGVEDVVTLCPEKQVVGTNAGWVVAVMEDQEPVRNGAMRQLPCPPMSAHGPTPDDCPPVAVPSSRSGPLPALAVLVNTIPEWNSNTSHAQEYTP